MLKRHLNRIRLFGNVLNHNGRAVLEGRMTCSSFYRTLRKQVTLSSMLRDAKHVTVGNRVYIDPFVPYYPSAHFNQLLDNNSVNGYPLQPIHGQIAITDKCPCSCSHCHVQNTQSHSLSLREILGVVEDMARLRFPLVFFVGGEPFCRPEDLCKLVRHASPLMDTRVFTSGIGVTYRNLRKLRDAGLGGICVSLDHFLEDIHNQRRRNKAAYGCGCDTVRWASEIGLYVSVVCCMTRTMIYNGELSAMVDFSESLGAHSIQLNEIRPVGNARLSGENDFFITPEDKLILTRYYRKQNESGRKIAVVMPWYNEEPDRFGCTATSGQHAYVDTQGNISPCVLLKASIGNIRQNRFHDIWHRFSQQCRHPVNRCIVYAYNDIIAGAEEVPLPPQKTMEIWPQVCNGEPSGFFKKIKMEG